jgi:hypothetical protein
MESQNQDNKYYINQGSMDKDFFTEYIREHIQTNLQKKCDKILEEIDFIEYYSIGLKSDRIACYSELWFIDIINLSNNKYLPVFIQDINTSSPYALSRCNMIDNEEEEEKNTEDDTEGENNNYKTLEEVLELCPSSVSIQISNILKKFS